MGTRNRQAHHRRRYPGAAHMNLDKLIEAVQAGTLKPLDLIVLDPEPHALAWKAFHGSLDAAKALHDALLPGWSARIWTYAGDDADATLRETQVSRSRGERTTEDVDAEVDGDNPARAWLLAILRALQAEGRT